MDNRDNNRINQILTYLAGAASVAADGVNDVVQGAGSVVSSKYNAVKLTVELNRLHDAQAKLFADIGRTMFMIKTGVFNTEQRGPDGVVVDAQKTVDDLLQAALDKQAEIDSISAKLSGLGGNRTCPVCGKAATGKDIFCAQCGAKMPHAADCTCGCQGAPASGDVTPEPSEPPKAEASKPAAKKTAPKAATKAAGKTTAKAAKSAAKPAAKSGSGAQTKKAAPKTISRAKKTAPKADPADKSDNE